jgi:hypothetical protein
LRAQRSRARKIPGSKVAPSVFTSRNDVQWKLSVYKLKGSTWIVLPE